MGNGWDHEEGDGDRVLSLGWLLTFIPGQGGTDLTAWVCSADFGGVVASSPIQVTVYYLKEREFSPLSPGSKQHIQALGWVWGRCFGLPISFRGLDCTLRHLAKSQNYFSALSSYRKIVFTFNAQVSRSNTEASF